MKGYELKLIAYLIVNVFRLMLCEGELTSEYSLLLIKNTTPRNNLYVSARGDAIVFYKASKNIN